MNKEELKRLLIKPASLEYFIRNVDDPGWFDFLKDEMRAFSVFPVPKPTEDGKYIQFDRWWVGQYLIKVADKIPEKVAAILKQMTAKNEPAINDGIKAILKMPISISREMIPTIDNWLDAKYQRLIPHYSVELFKKFIEGNDYEAALGLFDALSKVIPNKVRNVSFRYETYDFTELSSKHLPKLLENKPAELLSILEKRLKEAIKIDKGDSSSDLSAVWRPAIESHEQNWDHDDVKDLLAELLRDALESLCRRQPEVGREFIQRFLKDDYSVFRRVAVHALRTCKGNDDIIRSLIKDQNNLYSANNIRHEFLLLVKAKLGTLSDKEQDDFFAQLLIGPAKETCRKTSDEEFEKYRQYRIRDALAPLSPILENRPDLIKYLKELEDQLGKPEFPDIESRHFSWTGPESPLDKQSLAKMDVDQLLKYITEDFRPTKAEWGPSPEGLSRILEDVVQDNPTPYAEAAIKFFDVAKIYPAYPTGLVRGLEKACQIKKSFPLKPVLELCKMLASTLDSKDIDHHERRDEFSFGTFKWSRGTVCNLLEKILHIDEFPITNDEMEEIKRILFRVAEKDPNPEIAEENSDEASGNIDFVTECINVTRGKALHAVMAYSLRWVRKFRPQAEIEAEKGKGPFPPGPSRFQPDVKEFLGKRLIDEPCPSVQATYGYYLPQLYYLDKTWVNEKRTDGSLFPTAPERQLFWQAQWEGFIGHSNYYQELFEMLRNDFKRAIEELAGGEEEKGGHDRYRPRLAEYLMIVYWQGLENLEHGSLIELFFFKAKEIVRSHAIWFLGNIYKDIDSESERQNKWPLLKSLWEQRKSVTDSESAAFSRWFEFIPESVESMFDLIKATIPSLSKGYQEEKLLDYLIKHVEAYPKLCIELLIELLQFPQAVMNVSYRMESLREILVKALASKDAVVVQKVYQAINRLGELGYYECRDLLGS